MALYGAAVEYALHTLLNLTYAPPGTAPSARELADFQRLSVTYVRKLLTQLAKAGLVEGSEGVRGGWQLARDSAEITVLDVVDAIQGPDPLFECRNIRERCVLWPDGAAPTAATSGVCSIHAVMLSAEAAMRRELATHTLAGIATQVRAKASPQGAVAIPDWFAQRFAERRPATPGAIEQQASRPEEHHHD